MDFCFCTLALGKKYRDLAGLLARDIETYASGTYLIILTDKVQDFSEYGNVLAFAHQQYHVYPYHDKRFVIAKAISMFDSCIFLDADMRIMDKVPSHLEWLPGITARSGCSLIKHNQNRQKQFKFIQKVAQKLEVALEDTKFVHEFLFTIKRNSEREIEFLEYWKIIAHYLEFNGIYQGEGNAIGLAAAKAGLPVRFDSQDRIKFFKDRIEKVRIEKGQVDPHEKLKYFELQKQIEFPQYSLLVKIANKVNGQFNYLYRLLILKILALRDFNFYYR
ncbi:MAG TPA: hypothetical protein DDZ80_28790 [Cyanobacteria bacterium UBA8803]|nr:hypothetical protein [Cyanobacteria bacterium UBA9273]HBL62253.1 hypothetical protein [Cyanobacteria bacterium UBA8803]